MAEIKEIVVSSSVRLNTGQYQGTEFFVSHRHALDELDDPDEVQEEAFLVLEEAMAGQLARAYRAQGKSVSRAVLAKHHGLLTTVKPKKTDGS